MNVSAPARNLQAVLVAAVLVVSATAAGAAVRRGLPPGLLLPPASLDSVARLEMAAVDTAAYLAEDAVREASGVPSPMRFAARNEASITPDNAGTWTRLDDGSMLWRLRLASPGATNLNLHLDPFSLPAGASLWLYDRDGAMVQGPYTADNRNSDGELWTAIVPATRSSSSSTSLPVATARPICASPPSTTAIATSAI